MGGRRKARAEERDPLQRYYTPDALALACCRLVQRGLRVPFRRVVEPYAGGGAFLRAAAQVFPEADVIGFDCDPTAPAVRDGTARLVQSSLGGPAAIGLGPSDEQDLVITNPPYLPRGQGGALGAIHPWVGWGGWAAFLVRWPLVARLGGVVRPDTVWSLLPRPRFLRPDGTAFAAQDTADPALLLFAPQAKGRLLWPRLYSARWTP